MLTFVKHQILSIFRSTFWQKNLLISILTILMLIYMFFNFLLLGFFADIFIEKIFPGENVLDKFTQLLFYYFVIDITIRFLLQKLPGLELQYYSLLPFKRTKLIHFPLIISALSAFNFFPLLLIVVFFLRKVVWESSASYASGWLLIMILMIYSNNFLNFSLKKRLSRTPLIVILVVLSSALLLFLDIQGWVSISSYWLTFVKSTGNNLTLILFPIASVAFFYYLAVVTMKLLYYPDDGKSKKEVQEIGKSTFSFLGNYGVIGRLVQVELKLIFRNKRSRMLFFTSLIMIVFFYFQLQNSNKMNLSDPETSSMILIGFSLIITGFNMLTYGQLLFSWESVYFDGILSSNIRFQDFLNAKFWLIVVQNSSSLLYLIPAVIINSDMLLPGLACFLFNIGFNSYLLIFAGMFNTGRIDSNKSSFANYQGTTVIHFILTFVVFGIPMLIYLPFNYLELQGVGVMTIAAIGLIGIALKKVLMKKLTEFFVYRKYTMSKGYREY